MNLLNENDWRDLDEQAREQSGLNDDTWETMERAAEMVSNKLIEDAFFGIATPPLSPELGTKPPVIFKPSIPIPNIPIITSPFITETVKSYRKRKRRFWEKVLRWVWEPVSFYPYTLVELYEKEVPSAAWINGEIICHPSLADSFRKTIGERYDR